MKSQEIREKFLHFFRSQGHTIVPSDSLVPSGDPTLLFTSAGMVQFKKNFLGQAETGMKRAVSCQRCLRTSDIEQVGITSRHLTFFEMLGNFSFGDYFKKEAVEWGWSFLTKDCGLEIPALYATIYKEDEEAFNLWKKFLPESKIVRMGEDTNFWNMGPTGPCGPCSEILYDRGEIWSQGHKCLGPACSCDRYLEVWNLVFTQFNRAVDGKLAPLPQKNIDTGMGLERLNAVMHHVNSPFDTDIFTALGSELKKWIDFKTHPEKSERIILDHSRAAAFLVCDGILPSNEGRGYILRRLIRRSLREGWTQGLKEPFLYRMVPALIKEMGNAYPELAHRHLNIQSVIKAEENNFLDTIETGVRILEDEIKKELKKESLPNPLGKVSITGERVFYIYETYGLDKEIQKEMVKDWGGELGFSEKEFEKSKLEAAERARKGWKGSGEKDVAFYADILKAIGSTKFRGYETLHIPSKVLAIIKEGKNSEELKSGEEGEIILEETPFYAESGGQVGDKGKISNHNNSLEIEITDTQKPIEGLIAHKARVKKGTVTPGENVSAQVDEGLRKHTARHHTATHLLHAALRKILGKEVTQAGSLVSPEKLRFDFTYPKALSKEQIVQIEQEVNRAVLLNISRKRVEESLDEARKLGALAFFGDKYGSKVFIVNYGDASTEVCGGTHCLSTGEIGLFKISAESSVGSNVRRIEAVAGEQALCYIQNQEKLVRSIAEKLKCSPVECAEKIDKIFEKQNELEKTISELKRKSRKTETSGFSNRVKVVPFRKGKIEAIRIVLEYLENAEPDALRETADAIRNQMGSGIVLLASGGSANANVSFVVTLTQDYLKEGLHAGKIAKEFAKLIEGNGGGRDSFAQGGGKMAPNLPELLEKFPEKIIEIIS